MEVYEYTEGVVWDRDGVQIRVAPTDHRPVAPTIGFRIEHGGASVVLAGDTVPCESLDALAAGAGALVHTVIRKDLDRSDAHATHPRHLRLPLVGRSRRRPPPPGPGSGILILTHYVPGIEPGQEDDWRALAASVFGRQIELGDDLHRVEVHPGVCAKPAG